MPIDINNVIARAQRLMLDENFNNQVEHAAAIKSGRSINEPYSGQHYTQNTPSYNYDNIEILKETKQDYQETLRNSHLPKSIKESFSKTPPLEVDFNDRIPTQQILEQYGMSQYNNIPIANTTKTRSEIPQQPMGSSIDYNYIKYLIDESIKAHMQTLINESTNFNSVKGMRIVNGNVFQFLDNKGNLYEGVLKLKKKAVIK